MIFLLIGALFIISNQNLRINKDTDFKKFAGLYYSWFGSLFDNLKDLSGYVIKSEWLPQTTEKINLTPPIVYILLDIL